MRQQQPPQENVPKPSQGTVGPAAFGPGGAPPPNPFAFPDDVDASASGGSNNSNPFFNMPSNGPGQVGGEKRRMDSYFEREDMGAS